MLSLLEEGHGMCLSPHHDILQPIPPNPGSELVWVLTADPKAHRLCLCLDWHHVLYLGAYICICYIWNAAFAQPFGTRGQLCPVAGQHHQCFHQFECTHGGDCSLANNLSTFDASNELPGPD